MKTASERMKQMRDRKKAAKLIRVELWLTKAQAVKVRHYAGSIITVDDK